MPRDDLFTIGEFSAITGVGIYSLRYYDEIGALKPEYVDPVSNYRYYGYRQLSRIPAISICKDAGIKLSDFDSFLTEGSVDYDRLLEASRRSLEKIIDGCRKKEHEFDQIEKLCSIRNALRRGQDISDEMSGLDVWAVPLRETDPGSGSSDLLVKLSGSAGRHKVRISPSVHGILKTGEKEGCHIFAFSMLAEADGSSSDDKGIMHIPGGRYLFSPMGSYSIETAEEIIKARAEGRQTDHIMSLALISDGDTGPLYCAAARLSG